MKPWGCLWCNSLHVADSSCSCTEPCFRKWCPARLLAEPDPDPYRL